MKKVIFQFLFLTVLCFNVSAQKYTNPIIHEDYSDPDAISVGNWYYMVASSFTSVPGLPILRSDDLVHWQLVNYALKNNIPADYYKKVQHGAGVWAPSIRFHNGEFYIYYPDPDFGIYMIKTKNILGNWSNPELVLAGKGLIDPCPLWDDNGKAYLVHAYAGSRAGIKSVLALKEMNASGTKIINEGKLIYDGHGIDPTVEGPKFYKRNGYYYVFAPAGGVSTGWQIVLRSKNIYGPYERKKVMEQGASNINGPHQGAWIQTNAGQDWFIHFQDKGAFGRITHLQPLTWKNDWPIIGIDKDGDGIGTPVSEYVLPKTAMKHTDFKTDSSLHFQWNATPSSTWRMEFENGFRHYAVLKNDSFPNLWNFPAMYLAKLPAAHFIITKLLKFNSFQVGERAGFILFGKSYASLELENTNHGLQLNYVECEKANIGSKEKSITLLENAPSLLFVRMQVSEGAIANFSYSLDGKTFIQVPNNFKAVEGVWVGAKYGFYCASNHPTNDAGFLETN
jgi:beta-xylosidase